MNHLARHLAGQGNPHDEASVLADGRRETRLPQFRRTIRLRAAGREQAMAIVNLSARGASGSCATPPAAGATVTLLFEDDQPRDAIVRWTREDRFGVQFVRPLPLDLLRYRLGREQQRARARRFKVARSARVIVAGHERPAVIRNISSGGMMIETSLTLPPGQQVVVVCGSLTLEAQVRWSGNGMAGLMLQAPISLDEFEVATASAGQT